MHTHDEEGLSFPVANSGAAEVEAELPQAVCELHWGSRPGEGLRNSWQVGYWQLEAPWGSATDVHIAQISFFILKHPPGVFSSSEGAAENTDTAEHPPAPHGTALRDRSQARRAGRASCGNICMPLTRRPPGVDK